MSKSKSKSVGVVPGQHFRKTAVVAAWGLLMVQSGYAQDAPIPPDPRPTIWTGALNNNFFAPENWPPNADDSCPAYHTDCPLNYAPIIDLNARGSGGPSWGTNPFVTQIFINADKKTALIAPQAQDVLLTGQLTTNAEVLVGSGAGQSGALNLQLAGVRNPEEPESPLMPEMLRLKIANTTAEPAPEDPAIPTARSPFRVGDQGGTGEVELAITYGGLEIQGYPEIGALGGNGSVTLLGSGKTDAHMATRLNSVDWLPQQHAREAFRVGTSAGTGAIHLNGAGLTVNGDGRRGTEQYKLNELLHNGKMVVGSGVGSSGSIDVLNGGKLAVWPYSSESTDVFTDNLNRVGLDGGVGSIRIAATVEKEGAPPLNNRLNLNYGLSLGVRGGTGQLDVLSGGKAWIHKAQQSGPSANSCPADIYLQRVAPLTISDEEADQTGGQHSWVRIAGENANLLVSGKGIELRSDPMSVTPGTIGRVQIASRGGLVVGGGGVLQVGAVASGFKGFDEAASVPMYGLGEAVTRLGPVDVTGSGGVYYGSEVANEPQAPGSIEASQIDLKTADGKLVFNHSATDFTFDTPLAGSGQLLQQAGTTIITANVKSAPQADPARWILAPESTGGEPACQPPVIRTQTDQLAFTGPVVVSGGTLVLPDNDVLRNASSFTVQRGGTLIQSGTVQNLNAVTLEQEATLRLAGDKLDGTAASATDIAVASHWTGGGTVELDTVLGTNGSPSDKLVITGDISGQTKLKITNLGGAGAATTGDTGILVVQVEAAQSLRRAAGVTKAEEAAFVLAEPVAAGGFNYVLKQVDGNWYLVTAATPTAPTKPGIGAVIDDVGSSTGDLSQGGTTHSATTDDTTPTVTGTGATPGNTITLYSNGQPVGSATVKPDGSWSVEPGTPLAPGVHALTVTEKNAQDQESPPSDPFTVTIEETKTPQVLPVLVIGAVIDDVGNSRGDLSQGGTLHSATTDDTTPTVTGGGATPGATITLYDNGQPVGTATANADGSWSVTPATPLANGSHPLTVTQKTANQPESAVSGVFTVTIQPDKVIPPQTTAVPVPTLSSVALAGLVAMMGMASALVRRRKNKPL